MKKIATLGSFIFLLIAFLQPNAFAQDASEAQVGNMQIGAGLMYGSEIEQPGLRIDGTYQINEDFRGVADLGFYLPEDVGDENTNWFEFNANGNYIFANEPDQGLIAYALAGINYTRVSVGDFDNAEVGFNLGAGAEYGLDFADLFGELKFVLGDYDQLNIGVGLRFPIGN